MSRMRLSRDLCHLKLVDRSRTLGASARRAVVSRASCDALGREYSLRSRFPPSVVFSRAREEFLSLRSDLILAALVGRLSLPPQGMLASLERRDSRFARRRGEGMLASLGKAFFSLRSGVSTHLDHIKRTRHYRPRHPPHAARHKMPPSRHLPLDARIPLPSLRRS
jgi:hypothetical protein